MPFIEKTTIDKVQDLNLVEVIGNYVELKKKGTNFFGLSPFVTEKTPSFSVNPVKNIWKCFASGRSGNNAISFLMSHKSLSYPEAIQELAQTHGIAVQYGDNASAEKYIKALEAKEELRPVMQSTLNKFYRAFNDLPDDHPAKQEVYKHRQYNDSIVEDYGIGYAPGQRFIYDLCVQHGVKALAKELGLISDKGDKWSDRVIYTLYENVKGKKTPIGLAGRRLSDDKKYAKWLNPIKSKLYDKDCFWYGMINAREAIVKENIAWLVEGYNDVIGFQTNGLPNTIASCGTAITNRQITTLKKICNRVVLCFDPDAAGLNSMLKYIKEFLREGFRVYVQDLGGMDPDDFVRFWKHRNSELSDDWLKELEGYTDDGFQFLLDNIATDDEIENSINSKKMIHLIASIEDDAMQEIYLLMLQKTLGLKITTLKKWLKEESKPVERDAKSFGLTEKYDLPKDVDIPIERLEKTIERYSMFMANHKIYVMVNRDDPPYTFKAVSNFDIEIIQHMRDEQFPSKLVRIHNIYNENSVFDMPSADINTPKAFETAVTNHGNFRWKGKGEDHELLKTYLFDKMGTGRRIDVLGWQPEGFWVWNNLVVTNTGQKIEVDDNGCFMHQDIAYYIPSANQIYARNMYRYDSQKRFLSVQNKVSFLQFTEMLTKVHRHHGIMGILFSISSMFQDIVVRDINAFPLLFLYGPASSGKDQLADACQTFFGQPQVAINLEGKASTDKAKIREFAQLSNSISQLSEYKPGNPDLDGILKGLWDRRGYKRGTLDSKVSSESIPILSSVIMTGNFEPDQDALITRCIYSNMDKTAFSEDERKAYEQLSDVIKSGYSSFTNDFLKHRLMIEQNFTYQYRMFYETLNKRLPDDTNSRMVTNLSVLGTFYMMFKDEFQFAFTLEDMMSHFEKLITLQMNKLKSANVINKFWDCFLASMRGSIHDQIRVNRDFNVEGDLLYFQWTSCFNKIKSKWFSQYRGESAPGKAIMSESLKKDKAWVKTESSYRFSPGSKGKNTSAYVVDLSQVTIGEELQYAIEFQQSEGYHILPNSPATPENDSQSDEKNNKDEDPELPF